MSEVPLYCHLSVSRSPSSESASGDPVSLFFCMTLKPDVSDQHPADVSGQHPAPSPPLALLLPSLPRALRSPSSRRISRFESEKNI